MLIELSIRNLAVIESVRVQFDQGFQVLTGETGAGKSMIVDALSLIIGGRGSAEGVRHGTKKAEVEAMFELASDHPVWRVITELGIEADHDEQLVIRREVSASGKSTARVNGRLANVTMLRKIGEWLVNIHGQHEHQSLLKTEQHIEWLDLYGGELLKNVKDKYTAQYEAYVKHQRELDELMQAGQQNLQMLDMYRFQIEEIETANLVENEEEQLAEEKNKLTHAERLFQSVTDSYDNLHDGGLAAVGQAVIALEQVVDFDPERLQPMLGQVQSALYQLEDVAMELRHYRDEVAEFNPERLEIIEQRLDVIFGLKRKYGNSIPEILTYFNKIKEQLNKLDNKDERIEELQQIVAQEKDSLTRLAEQLTALRKNEAKKLSRQIEQELTDLHMEKTQFTVQIKQYEQLTRNGRDEIEFMIAPNIGEPARPLIRIASGGELSRIMLALKTIFAKMDQIPVLIFDEVDTGVSGRAAQAIAEKLSVLSMSCQVFSITHLPQVACMADGHYGIHKQADGEKTFTNVRLLHGQARVSELARMLGGVEVTETTEQHALEMLALADHNKEQRNHLQ